MLPLSSCTPLQPSPGKPRRLPLTRTAIRYYFFFITFFLPGAISAQPVISSFSPASGAIGTTITLTGAGFSPVAANNIVYFGAVKATVTLASSTSLAVTVPAGATYQPISVTVNNLTGWSSKPFIQTFTGAASRMVPTDFGPSATFQTDLHPNGVVLVDLDGDGKPDLATANNYSTTGVPATVSVLRNTSSSGVISFAPRVDYPTGPQTYSIAAGDLDGDGRPDLVVTASNDSLVILRNTSTAGAISFAAKIAYLTGNDGFSVAIGDFDGDGKPDLVVANYLSTTLSIYKNTSSAGNISFAPKADIPTAPGPSCVIATDLDGDGKPDLAVSNELSNSISVFRNTSSTGAITFAPRTDYGTSPSPIGITAGDFDGDGKPELAVSQNNTTNGVSIYLNVSTPGTVSFSRNTSLTTDNDTYNNAIGDLNGDGRPDIVAPYANQLGLFQETAAAAGSMGFSTITTWYSPGAYNPAIGDLDGDGKPDIVITGLNIDYITILRNRQGEPAVTSFSPASAANGGTVTITGVNFTGITGVSFGGVPAASFTVNSSTSITAVVGAGASGDVVVTSTTGTTGLPGFTFIPPPVISSFTPTTGIAGTTVTINGQNFNGATSVSFGGVPAASYTIPYSAGTLIIAVVGTGASGAVSVTGPYGTGTLAGFTFINPPAISSFLPVSGSAGTTVTITGTDLSGTTAVSFGGTPAASFTVVSPTTVTAVLAGGSSGAVSLTTQAGTATLAGFTYILPPAPVVSSFTPASGKIGVTVTITGNNFNSTPAGNIVYFGATRAQVLTASATQLTVKAPSGATFEPVSVLNSANGLTGYAAKPFMITYTLGGHITTHSFASPTDFPLGYGSYPIQVIASDMDGDGEPDIIVNRAQGSLNILYDWSNSPSIAYHAAYTLSGTGSNYGAGSISIADLDGDGARDIVSTTNTNYISVFRNNASGTFSFQSKQTYPTYGDAQKAAIGDLDGDGRPDIVVTNFGTATVSVLRNTSVPGLISLAPKADYATGQTPTGVAIGDLDGDGLPDVVVANSNNTGTISVLKNTSTMGAISFAPKIDYTTSQNTSLIWIADINNDGKSDIIVMCGTLLSIFKNTSTAGVLSFSPKIDYAMPSQPNDMAVGDVNGDGKPDIVLAGQGYSGGQLNVMENTGSGTILSFAAPVAFNTYLPWSVALMDVDADGKTDLFDAAPDYGFVSMLHNQTDVPYITSFTPTDAATGDTVTITGYNFIGVTGVLFNYTVASSYIVNSSTSISAVVGTGTSGTVIVGASRGNASLDGFTYIGPLGISSFSPVNAGSGATISITGSGFRGITGVSFGGVPATSFSVNSYTNITAVVGAGASGNVTITTAKDTVSLAGFTFFLPPSITSFTPDTAITGTQVTITGVNLSGATAVSFGGIPATSFTINSPTSITATVVASASGNVTVTTPGGTATLAGFIFIPLPTINALSPGAAGLGIPVNIYGTHFDIVTAVSFGGVSATSFTIVSPTNITAIPGAGASGTVRLESPGGAATMVGFEYLQKPIVSSFTPGSAVKGATINIKGRNFLTLQGVSFGGVAAASFNHNDSTISAVVAGGATGAVSVATLGGTDSLAGFTFIVPPVPPVITLFTPASATAGASVTITGTGFTGATGVQFGGTEAASFTVNSATNITAVLGKGASGDVSVTTPGGTATSPGFIFTTITAVISPNNTDPKGLVVFPNPASDQLYVRYPASAKIAQLTLTDIAGRTVKTITIGRGVTQTELSVKGLAAGIYEISWSDGVNQLRQTVLVY